MALGNAIWKKNPRASKVFYTCKLHLRKTQESQKSHAQTKCHLDAFCRKLITLSKILILCRFFYKIQSHSFIVIVPSLCYCSSVTVIIPVYKYTEEHQVKHKSILPLHLSGYWQIPDKQQTSALYLYSLCLRTDKITRYCITIQGDSECILTQEISIIFHGLHVFRSKCETADINNTM